MYKAKNEEVDATTAIENMIPTALGDGVSSSWLGAIGREQLRPYLKYRKSIKLILFWL